MFPCILSLSVVEANTADIETYSPSCLLIDNKTGKILYEKNAYEKRFPASTTKIMTAILALENCDLSEKATVSYNAIFSVPSGYANANLQLGEELTVEQLLYALLLPSANDAANVLAEHIAGSVESFSTMMNTKAAELGCQNTHFVNPNGVQNEDHYSTAYDLSLIAQYAMKNPTFRTMIKTTTYTLPATNKYNNADRVFATTNDLIRVNTKDRADNYYYKYANGIKTGYTSEAKNCIVASATRDGLEFIAVVLGAGQTESGLSQRYLDCKTLFDYGFENYTIRKIKDKDSVLKQIKIDNATKETQNADLLLQEEITVLSEKNTDTDNLLPTITIQDDLKAPLAKGTVVGSVTYEVLGVDYTTNLILGENVEKSSLFIVLLRMLFIIIILFLVFKLVSRSQKKARRKRNYKRYKI